MFFNNLKGNPFTQMSTISYSDFQRQPFILLHSQKTLQGSVNALLNSEVKYGMRDLIIGDRGLGKTTTLLFIADTIQKFGNDHIHFDYFKGFDYFRSIMLFMEMLEKKFPNKPEMSREKIMDMLEAYKKLSEFLGEDHYFILVDVPDDITSHYFKDFARTLEYLIGVENISIIIAMNKSHKKKIEGNTEILGKFSTRELQKFEFEETKELVIQRLNLFRITDKFKDTTQPFTEESIIEIHNVSIGIPRNIINSCKTLFDEAIRNEKNIITSELTREILKRDFTSNILIERIEDPSKREVLMNIVKIINEEFNGFCKSEIELQRILKNKFGWDYITMRKRVRLLEKYGLIEMCKDPDNLWKNQIKTTIR